MRNRRMINNILTVVVIVVFLGGFTILLKESRTSNQEKIDYFNIMYHNPIIETINNRVWSVNDTTTSTHYVFWWGSSRSLPELESKSNPK